MKNVMPVAVSKSMIPRAHTIVQYLVPEEIILLCEVAMKRRNGERDALLIKTLFETGVRVSEALSLTPRLIDAYNSHAVLFIKGKGKKPRMVACPDGLAYRLKSYAYTQKLELDDRIFQINRQRAWQILKEVAKDAGLQKRIYPHLLRHSDAIERLRLTGNPMALKIHLGHSSMLMTMRYLSTLTAEDALKVMQSVEFNN